MSTLIQNQMAYFPYISMGKESFKYGNLILWNFSEEKEVRIPEEESRNYIAQLLNTNTYHKRPLENIGIIFIQGKDPFAPFGNQEIKLIREFRIVLFLCGVAHSNIHDGENAGHYMLTTENFSIAYQNFKFGDQDTAYTAGIIITKTAGGLKLGEVIYEMPPYVMKNTLQIDPALFSVMKRLKRKNASMFRRILRATEAFMNGYCNSSDLSFESRILEHSRAFEILLELPEKDQRKIFKEKIENSSIVIKEKIFRYKSERSGNHKVWEQGTIKKIWADRFYVLRNHIIHGEKVTQKEFFFKKQRHQDLALWFFLVAVKKAINHAFGKELFYDVVKFKDKRFIYDNQVIYAYLLKELEKRNAQARALPSSGKPQN
jgi:hypothetical protein